MGNMRLGYKHFVMSGFIPKLDYVLIIMSPFHGWTGSAILDGECNLTSATAIVVWFGGDNIISED